MNFLDRFLGELNNTDDRFPKPTTAGDVSIENNTLICTDYKDRGMRSCVVNLDDLQYVYIKVANDKEKYLFLFDHHQNDIPLNYKGFKEVYTQLSDRFNFDDTVFFEHSLNSKPFKTQIWRRKHPKTYTILDFIYKDYNLGFEIQSNPKVFVSWDTTYNALTDLEHVFFETSPYNQKLLKFKYPVRIGNVILNTFQAYFDNPRTDVPVLHYYCDCYNDSGNDGSYFDLKHVLSHDVINDDVFKGYERADQKNLFFDLNKIRLSICYTYDYKWHYDSGNTSITIKNHREYPELLYDETYEKDIVISETLILKGEFSCPEDYMRNEKIKYRPKAVSASYTDQTLIWTDAVNNKIGCSTNNFAQIFDTSEIESFSILNILPARGSGGAELYIITTDKTYHKVLRGRCKAFDNYVSHIEHLTNKKVTFEKEYHDC
ncbi:hypothetical protein [Formosa algae]|uniref:Uncharacterized protein n=1 Tax=Formosa algae TaxID=225843 RepID=A0A9X1CD88_9FLAO|nr:hypothetical protein [Formosa algae]MBP1840979.1 hypothetical protein [Formosa algae]MDQ0336124.1 hypothetical protein [Formosa algae]OEI79911.1 hypothetical protein AST99_11515 [Formosa algae]